MFCIYKKGRHFKNNLLTTMTIITSEWAIAHNNFVAVCVCVRACVTGVGVGVRHIIDPMFWQCCVAAPALCGFCVHFSGTMWPKRRFIPSRSGPAELKLASTSASGFRARVPLKFVVLEALRRPPEARGGIQPVRTEHAQRGEAARQSAQVKVRCSDPCWDQWCDPLLLPAAHTPPLTLLLSHAYCTDRLLDLIFSSFE